MIQVRKLYRLKEQPQVIVRVTQITSAMVQLVQVAPITFSAMRDVRTLGNFRKHFERHVTDEVPA